MSNELTPQEKLKKCDSRAQRINFQFNKLTESQFKMNSDSFNKMILVIDEEIEQGDQVTLKRQRKI